MAFRDQVDSETLAAHRRRVRRCRGRACLTEALIATGARSGNQLETFLAGSKKVDSFGQPMWSGVCRRWCNGTALPSDQTIERIDALSARHSQVRYWRDHPLWRLMEEPAPRNPSLYCHILAGTDEQIRDLLFLPWRPSVALEPVMAEVGQKEIEVLRGMGSLDALVALLALTRLAELVNNDERHAVTSASAFVVLAKVVLLHKQLRASVQELFEALHFCFWSWWYLDGVRQEINHHIFKQHLAELEAGYTATRPISIGTLGHGPRDAVERMVDQTCAVLGIR